MLKKLVSQVELLESHIIPIKFATSANYEEKKITIFFLGCNKAKGTVYFTTI